MGIIPTTNSVLLSAVEQIIYNRQPPAVEGLHWYSGKFHLAQIGADDIVEINFYDWSVTDQIFELYDKQIITGPIGVVKVARFPPYLSEGWKIGILQTNSTPVFKNIKFTFYEVN
jgi:hypothetical protein